MANDNQGTTNSVVTNSMSIVVPFDWNANGVSDGWEWNNFTNLTTSSSGDNDSDGVEQLRRVSRRDAADKRELEVPHDAIAPHRVASSNHQVTVSTEPGRKYTIYWAEGSSDERNQRGSLFASTNTGVWIETSPVSTNHVFTDTEGTNTTGHAPVGGVRYYKVKVGMP